MSFRALRPETINSALLNLRAQIVREDDPGLKHVEALLRLRGVALPPVPGRQIRNFKRREMRRAVLAALATGPATSPELIERVAAAHGLTAYEVETSVRSRLTGLRKAGVVGLEGRVWRLEQANAI